MSRLVVVFGFVFRVEPFPERLLSLVSDMRIPLYKVIVTTRQTGNSDCCQQCMPVCATQTSHHLTVKSKLVLFESVYTAETRPGYRQTLHLCHNNTPQHQTKEFSCSTATTQAFACNTHGLVCKSIVSVAVAHCCLGLHTSTHSNDLNFLMTNQAGLQW